MSVDEYTNSEQWGYAALAVTIITLTAIFGLALIPLAHKRIWIFIQDFLLALGTATLLCDAILHLLPHGLGLHADHDHGEEEHDDDHRRTNTTTNATVADEDHEEHSEDSEYLLVWKLNVLVITFYLFWVYSVITKHYGHGHSHKNDDHGKDDSLELAENAQNNQNDTENQDGSNNNGSAGNLRKKSSSK